MTGVFGGGPLELNDAHGRMVGVSLEAFEVNNGVVAPRATWSVAGLSPADVAVVKALAKALGTAGVLQGFIPPSPQPAAIVSTPDAVPTTTTVKVTVSAVTPSSDGDVSKTAFTVKVEETSTWTALTTAGLVEAIGTSDHGALIHVVTPPSPTPGAVPATTTTWSPNPTADVQNDAATPATIFKLGARHGNSEGLIAVKASAVDTAAKTFTLTATWTKTVAGATVATAAADLAPLAYSILVAPPLPGKPFRAPAAVATTLAGGATAPALAALPAS